MVPVSLIAAGVLAVTALGAGLFGYSQGAKSVQAELDAYRAATAMAQEQLREQALARERDLQAKAEQVKKELGREKTRLAAVQRELADSLRKRPDRPSEPGLPAPAGDRNAPAGCTGSELYRGDAQFLIGLAARADTLRLQLAACQAAYGAAVKSAQ